MAIRSFPYMSKDGDNKITASNEAERIDQIVDSGIVFDVLTSFECSNGTGPLDVKIAEGSAIIKGHAVISDAEEIKTVSEKDTNPRIDLIVLESNTNADVRTASIKVIKGTPDLEANLVEPSLSGETGVSQIKLAKVFVPASGTNEYVTITDSRAACLGKHFHKLSQITDMVDADYKNPVGTIEIFAGSTAPQGWLLCQGQAVSRVTYASLFNIIGGTYGAGDGSTTFNVPNLKGRVPIGVDSSQTEFDTLGEIGGEKKHANSADENAPHTHLLNIGGTNINKATPYMTGGSGTFWNMAVGYEGINLFGINSSGNGTPHNNLQPYITLNYIIKY